VHIFFPSQRVRDARLRNASAVIPRYYKTRPGRATYHARQATFTGGIANVFFRAVVLFVGAWMGLLGEAIAWKGSQHLLNVLGSQKKVAGKVHCSGTTREAVVGLGMRMWQGALPVSGSKLGASACMEPDLMNLIDWYRRL